MNLSAYLAKSVSTGVSNTLLSAVSVLVFLPLIIENIGIDKYGVWAMLAIFTSAAVIADMGISKALVYFIPKEQDQVGIDKIFSAGFLVNGGVILVLCLITTVLVVGKINIWGDSSDLEGSTGYILTLCGASIFILSVATSLYRALLESLLKIYVVNLGFMMLTALYYGSAYIVSIFTNDIEILIMFSSFVYGGIFLFHFWYVYKFTNVSIVWPGLNTIVVVLRYALGSFSISLLTMVVQPVSRYYFVVASNDSRMYGYFDIALRLSLMANSLLATLSVPILSIFSSYGRKELWRINRILDKYFLVTIVLYFAGIILFFMVGELLLRAVFRIESAELFNACMIMMIGVCASGVAEAFSRALMGIGKLRVLFRVRLLLPITNFILIWGLSRMQPISRFSIAYSVAFGLTAIATIVTFRVMYLRWGRSAESTS